MEEEKNEEIEYESEITQDAEEKISTLKKHLADCKKERQEYLAGWQRALADFQNYKKENGKEMEEFRRFAAKDTIVKVLPVLGNLEFASESMPQRLKDDVWVKGILQVKKQFENILKEEGIEAIEPKIGERFDPGLAEAVRENESKQESGTITEVVQRGYAMEGKVLKPAKVKVAK